MAARDIKLVVFGFLLALFSSFGQTFFIALFGIEIRTELGLSHGGIGSLYSLATLVSGLLMLWVGRPSTGSICAATPSAPWPRWLRPVSCSP